MKMKNKTNTEKRGDKRERERELEDPRLGLFINNLDDHRPGVHRQRLTWCSPTSSSKILEIKDRVRKDQSSSASHVPPSTSNAPPSHSSPKSPSARSTTKASMSRKMLSPMVARRRGRPCTKRKVSKVDEIVNRLKEKSKRPSKAQGRTVPQCQPRKLNFPSTDDVQYNTYHDPATQTAPYYFPCMDGTQQSMYVPARFSPMQTVDNIGGTSHAQSEIVNNIYSQSSTIAENFVDLNVDMDPNVPFFF
ncbi:unnamed protein product [Camellia sinensis]